MLSIIGVFFQYLCHFYPVPRMFWTIKKIQRHSFGWLVGVRRNVGESTNAWNSISNAIEKEGLLQYYILKNILIFIAKFDTTFLHFEIASVQMYLKYGNN